MNVHVWGAHAYSVLVSAFCGDELRMNVAARGEVSFEKTSRLANAFGSRQVAAATAPRKPITVSCCLTK